MIRDLNLLEGPLMERHCSLEDSTARAVTVVATAKELFLVVQEGSSLE